MEPKPGNVLLVTAWHFPTMRAMPRQFWRLRKLAAVAKRDPACTWEHRWMSRRSLLLTTEWRDPFAANAFLSSISFAKFHAAAMSVPATKHRRELYSSQRADPPGEVHQ